MVGKTDYKKLRAEFKERQRKAEANEGWFKPNEGKHGVRILPPPSGQVTMPYFRTAYGSHYGLILEDSFTTVVCPRLTLKQPCPICEFTRTLWRNKSTDSQDLARQLGVKARFASNIILLNEPREVKKWSFPSTVNEQIEELCVGSDSEVPIDDPEHGYNLTIKVENRTTPVGVFPQYIVSPELKSSPLPDRSVLEKTVNLADVVAGMVKTYDEIRSMLLGAGHDVPESTSSRMTRHVPERETYTEVAELEDNNGADLIVETPVTEKVSVTRPASNEDVIKRAQEALKRRMSNTSTPKE